MAGRPAPEVQGFVLRAMAASEIAASCSEPGIRRSFEALTERWLVEAERAGEAARAARGSRPPAPEQLSG